MKALAPDFIFLTGLGMLGTGLYMFEPWVSFAVCGAILTAIGVLMGRTA